MKRDSAPRPLPPLSLPSVSSTSDTQEDREREMIANKISRQELRRMQKGWGAVRVYHIRYC
jgi:hypothetical protein